jgi:hypothetical protein
MARVREWPVDQAGWNAWAYLQGAALQRIEAKRIPGEFREEAAHSYGLGLCVEAEGLIDELHTDLCELAEAEGREAPVDFVLEASVFWTGMVVPVEKGAPL